MADPFSIVVGTAGLLDVSWRVFKYLKDVREGTASVEEEIAALSHEIETLISVNESLEDLWASEGRLTFENTTAHVSRVERIWRNTGTILADCRATVQKLEVVLKKITGKKKGHKVAGTLDGIRKQLRKQSKSRELVEIRQRLTTFQNGLQTSLMTLNL